VATFICLLTILFSLISTTTQDIEKSFLQNDAKMLYEQFSAKSFINISLPEPISFSDQLSNQQAYFLFKRIFSNYLTFEFYSESELPFADGQGNYIFKARWSFKNKKNNNQHVFHIFFYLTEKKPPEMRHSQEEPLIKIESVKGKWKITEIKAEKF